MPTPLQKSVTELAAFRAAATRWGVPIDLLWGVYGMETEFGKNIATSSAGAVGAMQFMPDTANSLCKQWHGRGCYPLTNSPNAVQFTAQVNAAAHYIAMLKKEHGTWNAAINAYSGGGYNADDALKKAQSKKGTLDPPGSGVPGVDEATGAISDAANAATEPLKAIAGFIGMLFQADTWFRIGKVLLGGIALIVVAYQLLR